MNSLTIVLMIIAGLVLVYASVKGLDPRDVVKGAFSQGKDTATKSLKKVA